MTTPTARNIPQLPLSYSVDTLNADGALTPVLTGFLNGLLTEALATPMVANGSISLAMAKMHLGMLTNEVKSGNVSYSNFFSAINSAAGFAGYIAANESEGDVNVMFVESSQKNTTLWAELDALIGAFVTVKGAK